MSDPVNPYAQLESGNQSAYAPQPTNEPPTFAQSAYAQSGYVQPGYVQPGYAQPGYAQPGYAQPGYAQPVGQPMPGDSPVGPVYGNPSYTPPRTYEYESIASRAVTIMVLSVFSFLTIGPLLSVPVAIWASVLTSQAKSIGAPDRVRSRARASFAVSLISAIIQVVGLILFILLVVSAANR